MTKQPFQRKPDWLKVRFAAGPNYARIDRYHREQGLHTVCRSAACPNQGECWSKGTATFMVLGDRCTRNCAFCNVRHGNPEPTAPLEPQQVAEAIAELGLRHAVITSVTRDDLPDGGAAHFARLTEAIRTQSPQCRIELLIPDLQGNWNALDFILAASPDILGHNIETVPRLYAQVRQGASYSRSLELLYKTRQLCPSLTTKSGIMLGMGENTAEVEEVMRDLRHADCNLLTLGQYLAPTQHHHPVARYIPPLEFDQFSAKGRQMGFDHIEAGPLVRSSYHAEAQFEEALNVEEQQDS